MIEKSIILEELKKLEIQLPDPSVPFEDVPNGYFDSLNDDILTEIRLKQFLSSLSTTPFQDIPNDYFESLHDNIMEGVRENAFIQSLPSNIPFEVPAHYFEDSVSEIVSNSRSANYIASLPLQTPYQVPVHYFDELADEIISKNPYTSKISPLRATRTFYGKLSIAASLFIFLSIGFLLMFHSSNTAKIENQLAQVSDAEINNYMQAHAYEFENEMSFQSIDESKVDFNKLENDIYNSYFESISNEEINNFL